MKRIKAQFCWNHPENKNMHFDHLLIWLGFSYFGELYSVLCRKFCKENKYTNTPESRNSIEVTEHNNWQYMFEKLDA